MRWLLAGLFVLHASVGWAMCTSDDQELWEPEMWQYGLGAAMLCPAEHNDSFLEKVCNQQPYKGKLKYLTPGTTQQFADFFRRYLQFCQDMIKRLSEAHRQQADATRERLAEIEREQQTLMLGLILGMQNQQMLQGPPPRLPFSR